MTWVPDDGGRAESGFKGSAGDCVVRAIAIAAELPYRQVYDDLHQLMKDRRPRKNERSSSTSPRDGVHKDVIRNYMEFLGWDWTPTMGIGTGTTVHLLADELPGGRIIANCSKHSVAVIDGIIHDTHDPSRDGTRAVYGYFTPPREAQ